MSRFCPSYAAYSVTVSCRIALFQQLVIYCIGADSVDSADSTDSAISVTRK